MKRALFVIDMQNVLVGKNHAEFIKYDREKIISAVNEKISNYESENVFYICQIMKNNFISKLSPIKAYDGSVEAQIAEEVNVVSGNIIKKYKGDAFSNPELKKMLTDKNISEIEITGLYGGGCVALTALGAIREGFRVIMAQNAVATANFNIKRAEKLNKKLKSLGAEFI